MLQRNQSINELKPLRWRGCRRYGKKHYGRQCRILKIDGEPNEIPTSDKTFIWVDT